MRDDDLITPPEAARLFGVGLKTVERMVRDGALTVAGARNGRLLLYGEVRDAIREMTGGLPLPTPEMGELATFTGLSTLLKRHRDVVREWITAGELVAVARNPADWRQPMYPVPRARELSARRECRRGKTAPGRKWGAGEPPLDPNPTNSLPGSEERIRVYTERVRRGLAVFHPDDRRGDE